MSTDTADIDQRFAAGLAALPANLQGGIDVGWQRIRDNFDPQERDRLDCALVDELPAILACSEFIGRALSSDAGLLGWLAHESNIDAQRSEADIAAMVHDVREQAGDSEPEFMRLLRKLRRREWVRLCWRDLTQRADLDEVIVTLSLFADACVVEAVDFIHAALRPRLGEPVGPDGEAADGLVVIGMGKLGGYELNFSSDIDVIFCHADDGTTTGGQREVSNQEYAIAAAKQLIKILGDMTADGFVFRTDARLRPNGDSGPMSLSFDAMEYYYQTHGREWERYAMVKARIIAGDGQALLDQLAPFIYRKYLDFGAFESVRDLHYRIDHELDQRQSNEDIKRGYGGIRQLEFIVQSFQLMRGGRDPALRTTSLKKALQELVALEQVEPAMAEQLLADYTFLRTVEHRLQMVDDAQTHSLPGDDDELGNARLAFAMKFDDTASFKKQLEAVRARVHQQFMTTFGLDRDDDNGDVDEARPNWFESADAAEDEFSRLLRQFHEGSSWRNLSREGRERLDRLMPLVIEHCQQQNESTRVLARVIRVLESIGRRTTYFAMMYEYPGVLDRLVRLCAASPDLAAMLGRQPILFDELLRPQQNIDNQVQPTLSIDDDGAIDLEAVMTELREFKSQQFFHIANERVAGRIGSEQECKALTQLAETILAQVERCVRIDMGDRLPPSLRDDNAFMSIAYGKLGSYELGYTSDLDIVFIYDDGDAFDPELSQQAARFAQRVISLMTTRLSSGILYEIDTQLRPSGRSGTLVSSIDSFLKYQSRDAWTWEHQALVRARAVTGSDRLRQRFDAMRGEILTRQRDRSKLRQDVIDMRQRIADQRDKSDRDRIDLKFGEGALVDIEFIVQYLVLAHSAASPQLLDHFTTPALISKLAEVGALDPHDATTLAGAYQGLLDTANELRFMQEPALVRRVSVEQVIDAVKQVHARVFA